jgi:hypothetical protein
MYFPQSMEGLRRRFQYLGTDSGPGDDAGHASGSRRDDDLAELLFLHPDRRIS